MSVRNLSYNAIHSQFRNYKKDVSQRSIYMYMYQFEPARNGVFYFWIFFNEIWHISQSVDGHEKTIT
jgi:hypothetical protein